MSGVIIKGRRDPPPLAPAALPVYPGKIAVMSDPGAAVNGTVIFPEEAVKALGFLSFGEYTDANRNEQYAHLFHTAYRDANGVIFAVVRHIIQAKVTSTPSFVRVSAEENLRIKRRMSRLPGQADERLIQSWLHTHTNGVDPVPSIIDRTEQKHKYPLEEQFMVIFNPHKRSFSAYRSTDALPVNCVLVVDPKDKEASAFLYASGCSIHAYPDQGAARGQRRADKKAIVRRRAAKHARRRRRKRNSR